jgi:hypothetical protein
VPELRRGGVEGDLEAAHVLVILCREWHVDPQGVRTGSSSDVCGGLRVGGRWEDR